MSEQNQYPGLSGGQDAGTDVVNGMHIVNNRAQQGNLQHGIEVWIFMQHGAKTEPNSYFRTKFIHLCRKMNSKCNSLLICAQTVFQLSISSKMRYELRRGQNRDIDWV